MIFKYIYFLVYLLYKKDIGRDRMANFDKIIVKSESEFIKDGKALSKGRAVLEVIKDYCKKKAEIDYKMLKSSFPDGELREGNKAAWTILSGKERETLNDDGKKRFFTNKEDIIVLPDSTLVFVSNQWNNETIENFMSHTKDFGYTFERVLYQNKTSFSSNLDENWEKLLKILKENNIKTLRTLKQNKEFILSIDEKNLVITHSGGKSNRIKKEDLKDFENGKDTGRNSYIKAIINFFSKYKDLIKEGKVDSNKALNRILYGPPGTGKTYRVVNEALEILEGKRYDGYEQRGEAIKVFNRYVENGQIVFTTFHQSYGYEEFIEGYRAQKDGSFKLEDGIFKDLSKRAKQREKLTIEYDFNENGINVFKLSLGNTQNDEGEIIYDYCIQNDTISIGYGYDVDYSNCSNKTEIKIRLNKKYPKNNDFSITAIDYFKNRIKKGDLVFISNGNKKCRGICKVTGDYYYDEDSEISYNHFREVQWIYKDADISSNDLINKNFSQVSIYKISSMDINFPLLKKITSKKDDGEEDKYIIIIDEINRGNISKVFGELITLIETDKRLGKENQTTITLPYSQDKFGIPDNVYIIGTMNTADRSISLIDSALRRRFEFEEVMPDVTRLKNHIAEVDIKELLNTLNKRIEYLFDRDHTIGHAYFINDKTADDLINTMQNKVIPLLQEYFYEDWEKIELILGGATKNRDDKNYFLYKEKSEFGKLFPKASSEYDDDRYKYELTISPTVEALRNIYES